MHDPAQDLPRVAVLAAEGQEVRWLDPDGNVVRVINERSGSRADDPRDLIKRIRLADIDASL